MIFYRTKVFQAKDLNHSIRKRASLEVNPNFFRLIVLDDYLQPEVR